MVHTKSRMMLRVFVLTVSILMTFDALVPTDEVEDEEDVETVEEKARKICVLALNTEILKNACIEDDLCKSDALPPGK